MIEPTLHYRRKATKGHKGGGPLCGAFDGKTPPTHKLIKTWPDLFDGENAKSNACLECLSARNSKAAKSDQGAPEAVTPSGPPLPPADDDFIASTKAQLSKAGTGLLNGALYEARKAPLCPKGKIAVEATVHSFVDVLDHYDLLGYTTHPVLGLAINGYVLFMIVRAQPMILDQSELNRAFGFDESKRPKDATPAKTDAELEKDEPA